MKKFISIILSITIIFSFVACSKQEPQQEKYKASFFDLFDTVSTIIAYDNSQEEFDAHYEQFYNELKKYDNLFDIYNSYEGVNNLYIVNRDAAKSPVKVSNEIIDMLEYGKEIYNISNGMTNICFGAVLNLWHIERENAETQAGKLPDMQELKEASKHCSIDDLIIDKEKGTVFFKDPDMRLDVGAIAKGYAAQKVTEFAKESLWTSAAISIGGNVTTFGFKNNDNTTKWNIGLDNPDQTKSDYVFNLNISGECVVTSGDYQRYFVVDGKKYCHIINPDTLMPSEYVSAVSIICDDSALGDTLSTTLFNMSIQDGLKLVEKYNNVEAVWFDKEYNQTFSSGFEKYIKND